MNTATFWSMIEAARQQSAGDLERQLDLLRDALSRLPEAEIQEFDRILWMMMARAYRADLWEVAALVACGCSDDGFHEFQGWLIAQGQATFEKILEDPEALADIVDKRERFYVFEGRMTSIADETYEQKTGQLIPESGYREEAILVGGSLTQAEYLPAKYPRIEAKLGVCNEDDFFANWT